MPRSAGKCSIGTGKMHGRGAGNCAGGQGIGRMNRESGKGVVGSGMCGWFNASELAKHSPQENEGKLLREEAASLLKRQEEIKRRLSELE